MEPIKPAAQPPESKLHFLDYWRIIRIRKTVILAVFLLVVFTTTAITFILPESYMSTVRIAVEKDASDINPIGFTQASAGYDPYFITTEFEKIRSKAVLYPVIEQLRLNERWARRFGSDTPLRTMESFEILKRMMDVRQTRNTSLIEIRVYSNSKENPAQEAAEIANRIAQVYKETRLEVHGERAKRGIDALEDEFRSHDVKVRELQARVDELKGQYNISEIAGALLEPETVRRWSAELIPMEAAYIGQSNLLAKLKDIQVRGEEDILHRILTASPDPELAKLANELWTTETALADSANWWVLSILISARRPPCRPSWIAPSKTGSTESWEVWRCEWLRFGPRCKASRASWKRPGAMSRK
jgi:uncharacterized protein involved in exopolysaccharide biosynthesis